MSGARTAARRAIRSARDVAAEILDRKRVPCICPAQHDELDAKGKPIRGTGAVARTTAFSYVRGRLHERAACERCGRCWSRINA
ncbi:hypothetical protein Mnod_7339 [Methylobacterium nodulans ORS 2060]|uniref:Uncharacterized protein n=1 Tax=Methylobacterium nodulans (strain LMG 21967 / CNCM I-2342 / ORS 2060) TaxID=460265 RepID=B8ILV3_METNO|nr:hypothetical protein Mnod_7339 [Methylobacterium nodulans ORS 2060]